MKGSFVLLLCAALYFKISSQNSSLLDFLASLSNMAAVVHVL